MDNLLKSTSVVVHSSKASITATKPDKRCTAIQHQFVYAFNIIGTLGKHLCYYALSIKFIT